MSQRSGRKVLGEGKREGSCEVLGMDMDCGGVRWVIGSMRKAGGGRSVLGVWDRNQGVRGKEREKERHSTHNTRPPRNNPLAIPELGLPGPRIPSTKSITQPHALHDHGFEIRHLLQRIQLQRRAVRERSDELGVQPLVDARRGDDVEGGDGEGEGGGFDASADDDLRFVGETALRLVTGGQFGGEDFLEDGGFGVVGFYGFAGEGARDEVPLVLGLC